MGNQKIQNCKHSVQKAVDLTTPAKNRAKNCYRFEKNQINKIIALVRKLT